MSYQIWMLAKDARRQHAAKERDASTIRMVVFISVLAILKAIAMTVLLCL